MKIQDYYKRVILSIIIIKGRITSGNIKAHSITLRGGNAEYDIVLKPLSYEQILEEILRRLESNITPETAVYIANCRKAWEKR